MTAIEVKGLDHVVLRTERLAEVLSFYRDKLGLPVERTIAELGLYQLRGGASLVDILDANIWKAEGAPGESLYDHFCLQVAGSDPAALAAALDERGIAHTEAAERYGATGNGWSIYAKDPDGRTVELKLVGGAAP
jgi:catechol 2,3-dioxygenase-like lactoylglutathione lyase family enzyme